MRLMLIIQLIALVVLMVLTYFYWHIFKINLQNIEINGFDFEIYAAPSRGFGWRSLMVCAWSFFVGIRIRERAHLSLLSNWMLVLAGAFFFVSLALIFLPRLLTIADVYFYWYFYTIATIGLTALAYLFYDKAPQQVDDAQDYEDILDHLDKKSKS